MNEPTNIFPLADLEQRLTSPVDRLAAEMKLKKDTNGFVDEFREIGACLDIFIIKMIFQKMVAVLLRNSEASLEKYYNFLATKLKSNVNWENLFKPYLEQVFNSPLLPSEMSIRLTKPGSAFWGRVLQAYKESYSKSDTVS